MFFNILYLNIFKIEIELTTMVLKSKLSFGKLDTRRTIEAHKFSFTIINTEYVTNLAQGSPTPSPLRLIKAFVYFAL